MVLAALFARLPRPVTPPKARVGSASRPARHEPAGGARSSGTRTRSASSSASARAAAGAATNNLTAHGDQILAEHESLRALTAVRSRRGSRRARRQGFRAVGLNRCRRPRRTGCWTVLLGLVGGVVKTLGTVVGNVLLPNGADTSGPTVPPVVLRQTLGVNNSTWTGRGVGVAVIDSGLEMSSEFSGRVTAFYDFTTGGIVSSYPYDDYGHGTHVAGTIGGSGALSSNSGLSRPRAEREARRSEGAGQERRRLHERRHPGRRLRGGQPRQRSASRSSTCRSDIRSSSRRRAIRWSRRLSARCAPA